MAITEELDGGAAHVMFIPSAGMGHIMPFFLFITSLSHHGGVHCSVVTVLPTVSDAEADHFAALFAASPHVQRVDFNLLPLDAAAFPAGTDPFLLRWEALRRSAHLLDKLIAGVTTPPVSAVVTDVTLASHVIPVAKQLHLPCHILYISSAAMLSLCAYFPVHLDKKQDAGVGVGDVDIPGVRRIRQSSLPQPLHHLNHLFTKQFIENGRALSQADGILVNTFDALEPMALAALRDGKVVPGFPPVYAIGLLKSSSSSPSNSSSTDGGAGGEKQAAAAATSSPVMAWLEQQPARSVVYVAFGSRIAVTHSQIREMGLGLEASGCRFLWVLKTTVVDREDTAEPRDVLGDEFLERVKGRGLVTKGWVEQEAVLRSAAVGLFLSHSGWNSVTEATACGVPLLAWPRGGDQRVNAMALESGGVGVWMERWSWDGEDGLVSGKEIGEKVKAAMADAEVRARAAKASEEAAKAGPVRLAGLVLKSAEFSGLSAQPFGWSAGRSIGTVDSTQQPTLSLFPSSIARNTQVNCFLPISAGPKAGRLG